MQFDLENNFKLLEDKNKLLMAQLIGLRREISVKEHQQEQTEKRLAAAEKQSAIAKQQLQQAMVAAKTATSFGGMMPFTTSSGQL